MFAKKLVVTLGGLMELAGTVLLLDKTAHKRRNTFVWLL